MSFYTHIYDMKVDEGLCAKRQKTGRNEKGELQREIRDEFGQYVTFMYENVIIKLMLFTMIMH